MKMCFYFPVLALRVGNATLRPAGISLSSHPPVSSPRPDSPMITGQIWTTNQTLLFFFLFILFQLPNILLYVIYRNVCLWDTLISPNNTMVHGEKSIFILISEFQWVSFSLYFKFIHFYFLPPPSAFPCHENGATVLQYAPKQQLLITGGRKGFVCVFDIRQRQLLHTFQAHDSAIKALALDAFEDFFVTGSAEGNMKVTHALSLTHFLADTRSHCVLRNNILLCQWMLLNLSTV